MSTLGENTDACSLLIAGARGPQKSTVTIHGNNIMEKRITEFYGVFILQRINDIDNYKKEIILFILRVATCI